MLRLERRHAASLGMREARGDLLVGAQAVDEVVHHRGDGQPFDLGQTHACLVPKERVQGTLTPALSLTEGEGVDANPSPPEGERVAVRAETLASSGEARAT